MVLKSVLGLFRSYIGFLKEQKSSSILINLAPLINLKDENDDFFTLFTGIKLKSRQRAMKMLSSKLS